MGRYKTKSKALNAALVTCLLPIAAGYSHAANAEDAAAQDAAPKEPYKIEEIIVTAQRRSESLLTVPIAVTALSAQQLERAGVKTMEDLSTATPGLQINRATADAVVFMRGVGTLNSAGGNESSIAIYVDDVYYAEPAGALISLDNVERVEVLKGPQGTLFGRNATGGLINVVTPDPQAKPSVTASVGYESYQAVTGSLYATGGLTDNLKISISGDIRSQGEGYGRNLTLNTETEFLRHGNVRGKILWEPTSADRVTLAASYFRDTSTLGIIGPILPGTITETGATYTGNPRDTELNYDPTQLTEAHDVSLKWEHKLGDNLSFKSISAYRKVDNQVAYNDADLSPINLVVSSIGKHQRSYQQEFLLQGNTDLLGSKLRYTAGLFYFDNRTDFPLSVFTPVGSSLVEVIRRTSISSSKSYAVFGQTDYDLTARDTLTVGLRYTHDDQSIDQTQLITGIPAGATTGQEGFHQVTWRFALRHNFTDDVMAYASANRGYKSGLFNSLASTSGPPQAVKPELLDDYEVGLKGKFLDGALQLDLNGFYYNYDDLQVLTLLATSADLRNAAAAKIYGLEAQGSVVIPVPVGDFRVGGAFTAYHSEYTQFQNCQIYQPLSVAPFGNNQINGDCSGNRLSYIPNYTITLSPSYTIPISHAGGKFVIAGNYFHSDGFFYSPDNIVKQPPYNALALELSYVFPDDRMKIRVYGTNLTNNVVRTFVASTTTGAYATAAPPRIFGVQLSYRLN